MDLSVDGVETKGREDEHKTPSSDDENLRRKIINGKKTVESSQTVARGIIYEKCLAAPRWSLRKDIDAGFDAILRLEDLSLALDQGTMTTMTNEDTVSPSFRKVGKRENGKFAKSSSIRADQKILTPVLPTEKALLQERSAAMELLTSVICLRQEGSNFTLDATRMKEMIKINKCRKLLCRALQWLNQHQARSFLIGIMPNLQDFVGRGSPKDLLHANTLREKKEKWWDSMLDERLSQALCNCMVTAIGGGADRTTVDPTLPIECLRTFLNRGNKNIKQALEKRGVSMVAQAIVVHGQTFMQQSNFFGNTNLQQQWTEEYNKFVHIMS